jgi:hypothetical protein
MSRHKIDDLALGPAALVRGIAIATVSEFAKEGAMATVIGLDIGDVWIRSDATQGFRLHANEGIVRGVDDEGRDGDAIDDIGGSRTRVVVVGPGESAVVSGDAVVEHS